MRTFVAPDLISSSATTIGQVLGPIILTKTIKYFIGIDTEERFLARLGPHRRRLLFLRPRRESIGRGRMTAVFGAKETGRGRC